MAARLNMQANDNTGGNVKNNIIVMKVKKWI